MPRSFSPVTLVLLLVAFAIALLGSLARAEGSRSLYPSTYTGSRANLDVQDRTVLYAGKVQRYAFQYVYAQAGEYILTASSARSDGGDIRIYNPRAGGFGTPGREPDPGSPNFVCSTATTGGGTGRGIIASRGEEIAGPTAASAATASGGQYLPCYYVAPSTGIYAVVFTPGATSGGPSGNLTPLDKANQTIAAWDVTVRADANSTVDLNGRLFTYALVAFTGGNSRPVNFTYYTVTKDGYRYKHDMRGLDPNGFVVYANSQGFVDLFDNSTLYHDLRGTNNVVSAFLGSSAVAAQGAEFPLFFSDPSSLANATEANRVLSALGYFIGTPAKPIVTNATFTGSVGPSTSVVGAGGTFSFDVSLPGSYEIVVSNVKNPDNTPNYDPANVKNRVLRGAVPSAGAHITTTWDGKANDGTNFPVNTAGNPTYPYRVFAQVGEVHFPMVDAENNDNGGPTIQRLNGANAPDNTVYFDDRGYQTKNGTTVGNVNGTLCPTAAPAAPNPSVRLDGVSSTTNYRAWQNGGNSNTDCNTTAGWGDAKALDVWTFTRSDDVVQPLTVTDPAPVVTKTVESGQPSSIFTGGKTRYRITVQNPAGSSTVTNVKIADTLPAGFTRTSTVTATFSGSPAASGNNPAVLTNGSTGNTTTSFVAGTYTIPSGSSVTLSFEVTAGTTTGKFDNSATVTYDNGVATGLTSSYDGTATSNTAEDVTVTAGTNLQITKDDGKTSVAPGATNAYTIVVTNAGPLAAGGARIQDTPPATFTGVTWTCVGALGAVCPNASGTGSIDQTVATFPANGTLTYTLNGTVSPAATGTIANTATVTAPAGVANTNPAAVSGVTSATDTDTLALSADLSLTKTPSSATPLVGSSVTFTITVSNAGPSAATGVAVTDLLPNGYALTGNTPSQGSYNTTSGVWTVGTVNNGANATLTLTGTVLSSGTYNNSAQVTASGVPDPDSTPNNGTANGEDDTATAVVTPTPAASLTITKTDGKTTAVPGTTNTYTIVVTNNGPSAANGASVQDTPPAALTGVTWTCVGALGAVCPSSSGTGSISQTVATFPANGVLTYTLIGTVNPAATGTLTNTATVTAPAGVTNTTPGLASATDTDTLAPSADLSLTKTPSTATPLVGANVTFTITLSNAGPSTATGVAVTDLLPSGYTFVSAVAVPGSYNPANGVWTIGTVNSGASATLTLRGTVLATGTYTNSAQVTASGTPDPDSTPNNGTANGEDDTDTAVVTPTPAANLTITKTDGKTSVVPGATNAYTIVVTNNGLSAANGARVQDTPPATFTGVTWTCVGALGAVCPNASGTGSIDQTVATFPANGTLTYTLNGTVSPAATGTIANTATVTAPAGVTNTNPSAVSGVSSVTDTDTLALSADLSLTKTPSNATPLVGSSVTFTITVSNAGPSAATGVAVTDLLPNGYTFSAATPSQGSYNPASGLWTVGTVNNGASATLSLTGTVLSSGTYNNSAQVTASDQPDPDSTPNNGTANGEDDTATAVVSPNLAGTALTCDRNFYQIRALTPGPGSQLYRINRGPSFPGTFVSTPVGSASSVTLNGMAFNPRDGYLYALQSNSNTLYRIGTSGAQSVGTIAGLPAGYQVSAGATDANGVLYLMPQGTSNTLYKVDLAVTPYTATSVTLTYGGGAVPQFGDFAFNPLTNRLYALGVGNDLGLYEVNLSTNAVTRKPLSNVSSGSFGSVFFDAAGEMYGYDNGGQFYHVNVVTGLALPEERVTGLGGTDPTGTSDGASCAYPTGTLNVSKQVGTITRVNATTFDVPFTITVTNPGPTTLQNVQVDDFLAETFGVTGGSPTVTVSSMNVAGGTAASPAFSATNTRLLSGTDNLLPGAPLVVSFTARVVYATAGNVPNGTLTNRVYASSTLTGPNLGYTEVQGAHIPPERVTTAATSSVDFTYPVATYTISGTVFEDVNYGGGAGRTYAAADTSAVASGFTSGAIRRPGATVELYTVSGTTATLLATTTTDATGAYGFANRPDGQYVVRVVNASVTSARPNPNSVSGLLPVQTFRTNAGSADGAQVGGSKPSVADSGAAASGATFDTATGVFSGGGQSQTFGRVTLSGADGANVDFGFNFDTIVNTNNAGQGSLAQFIANSNALTNAKLAQAGQTAGKEVSIFMVPAAALTNGVAVISVTSLLPAVTDTDTSIDGTTQTANVRDVNDLDTNPGQFGTGGKVGVQALTLDPVNAPEVELNVATALGRGLGVEGDNFTLRGLALHGAGSNTVLVGATRAVNGLLIEGNLVGTTAVSVSAAPATNPVGYYGLTLQNGSGVLQNNFFGYSASSGVNYQGGVNGLLVQNNEFQQNGRTVAGGDAITVGGDGLAPAPGPITVLGNLIASSNSSGVQFEIGDVVAGAGSLPLFNQVRNNTITANGLGGFAGSRLEGSGIHYLARNAAVVGTNHDLIEFNVIMGNQKSGVVVNYGQKNVTISKNSFYGNGLTSIDFTASNAFVGGAANYGQGDGVTPNDGVLGTAREPNSLVDYPVFESVRAGASGLIVSGFVGTKAATGNAYAGKTVAIELYKADDDGNQSGPVLTTGDQTAVPHGEGRTYLGTLNVTLAANGAFAGTLALPTGVTVVPNTDKITATTTLTFDTSEFGPNFTATPNAPIVTLQKWVRNCGPLQGANPGALCPVGTSGFTTAVDGKPGDVLEYCIKFRNAAGAGPATNVVLTDSTFNLNGRAEALLTSYANEPGSGPERGVKVTTSASLTSDPASLDFVSPATAYLTSSNDADKGTLTQGQLTFRIDSLDPGTEGMVCFQARIR